MCAVPRSCPEKAGCPLESLTECSHQWGPMECELGAHAWMQAQPMDF